MDDTGKATTPRFSLEIEFKKPDRIVAVQHANASGKTSQQANSDY